MSCAAVYLAGLRASLTLCLSMQGNRNDTFFVVKDGSVAVTGGRKFVAGDFFQEETLTADSKVENDFVSVDNADLFQITRESFEEALAAVRLHAGSWIAWCS